MNDITQFFASMDGARIPGGCDDCDAWQEPRVIDKGIVILTVRHDDWCPTLRLHNRATRRAMRRKGGEQS